MELNINSPAYYTNQFGIDDEIYNMCQEIQQIVKNKAYSTEVDIVGIVPIIAPTEVIKGGKYKEIKRCELKYGFATVSLQIDYGKYINADIDEKKKLIINNVIMSIKCIYKKAKIDFTEFYEDIMQYCRQSGIVF